MISIEHPYLENLVLKQYATNDVSSTSVGSQRPWYLEQLCSIDTLGSHKSPAFSGFGGKNFFRISVRPVYPSIHDPKWTHFMFWLILQKSSLRCKPNMRQQGPKQQPWIALLRWWQPWLLAKAQSTVPQPKSFKRTLRKIQMQMDAVRVYECKRKQIALQLIKQNQSNSCRKNGPANTPKSRALIFNKNAMGHLKPRVHLFSQHAELDVFIIWKIYRPNQPKVFQKIPRQI